MRSGVRNLARGLRRLGLVALAGLGLAGLLVSETDAATGERRVALVIGNGAYRNVPALDNPRQTNLQRYNMSMQFSAQEVLRFVRLPYQKNITR